MSEKLCIQWNDFQDNIKSVFGNLRENNDFTDVTLACEDGQQVEAHKVILAASSPFFQKLLEERTGCCQDHLVCLHLLAIITGQGHISEVIVLSQVPKSTFDDVLKVIPLEAKFFLTFCRIDQLNTEIYNKSEYFLFCYPHPTSTTKYDKNEF